MLFMPKNIKGKGEDDRIRKSIVEFNKKVEGKELEFIYNYDQLSVVPYVDSAKLKKFGCHLGQRKLLMTEIQFMNIACVSDIVIYIGSAPCEHLPVIINLFPNNKFLLIDPNYHRFNFDFVYIYIKM
jgi:hypothetical protein